MTFSLMVKCRQIFIVHSIHGAYYIMCCVFWFVLVFFYPGHIYSFDRILSYTVYFPQPKNRTGAHQGSDDTLLESNIAPETLGVRRVV